MPFGYLGTTPNQQLKNSGVFSVEEALAVQKNGEWGGSLELIAEQTVSGVGIVDFTDIKENIYDVHFLTGIVTGNGNNRPWLRFFESGTIEDGSVYQGAYQQLTVGGSAENKGTSLTNLDFFIGASEVGESSVAYCYIYNAGDSSKYTLQTQQGMMSSTIRAQFGGGVLPQASVVNGFRLFIKKALPLTILTGIFSFIAMYLLKNSYNLDSAILKIIFIGLASLTFPHILLEYFLEKNEK